jgi:hypothetical protein
LNLTSASCGGGFEEERSEIIGHNFAYDARAFYGCSGIKVAAKVFDTMAAAAILWPPVADRKSEETSKTRLRLPFHSLPLCVLRTHETETYWKEAGSDYGRGFYQTAFGSSFAPYEWEKLYCVLDVLKTYSLKERLEEMMR